MFFKGFPQHIVNNRDSDTVSIEVSKTENNCFCYSFGSQDIKDPREDLLVKGSNKVSLSQVEHSQVWT